MFFIGDNNAREASKDIIDNYINGTHRPSSIYGLTKGDLFWAKDMTFDSPETALSYIKEYESKGFKVYHNIEMEKQTVEKVHPVEKDERKRSSRSRRKE